MLVGTLLTLGGLGIIFYFIISLFDAKPVKHDKDIDFNAVSYKLDSMQNKKERLKEIENLITDLTVLGNDAKSYTLKWKDNANQYHSYDFLMIDNESKNELLKIAKLEQYELRTSLSNDIEDLRLYVTERNKNNRICNVQKGNKHD